MAESPKSLLRNASRLPVELHLATGVRVLAPQESLLVSAAEDVECPSIAVLLRQGVLTRHAAPSERADAGGKSRKVAKPAKQPAKASGGRKVRTSGAAPSSAKTKAKAKSKAKAKAQAKKKPSTRRGSTRRSPTRRSSTKRRSNGETE